MRHRSLLITHHRDHRGSPHPHRLRLARRQTATAATAASKTTVVIGVDAPLTGSLSALGQGIKNSVDLAAKTANKNNEVPGVTFKIEALDDQARARLRPAERHQARRQTRTSSASSAR